MHLQTGDMILGHVTRRIQKVTDLPLLFHAPSRLSTSNAQLLSWCFADDWIRLFELQAISLQLRHDWLLASVWSRTDSNAANFSVGHVCSLCSERHNMHQPYPLLEF